MKMNSKIDSLLHQQQLMMQESKMRVTNTPAIKHWLRTASSHAGVKKPAQQTAPAPAAYYDSNTESDAE